MLFPNTDGWAQITGASSGGFSVRSECYVHRRVTGMVSLSPKWTFASQFACGCVCVRFNVWKRAGSPISAAIAPEIYNLDDIRCVFAACNNTGWGLVLWEFKRRRISCCERAYGRRYRLFSCIIYSPSFMPPNIVSLWAREKGRSTKGWSVVSFRRWPTDVNDSLRSTHSAFPHFVRPANLHIVQKRMLKK